MKTIVILLTLLFTACCSCGEYKYVIKSEDGVYHVKSYQKEGDCVKFKHFDRKEVTVCGTYVIEECSSSK